MTSQPGADLGPFGPLAAYIQEITEALAATTTQREVIEIVLNEIMKRLQSSLLPDLLTRNLPWEVLHLPEV